VLGFIRQRLSYANVAATLALVFALGGAAFAATSLTTAGVISGCVNKKTGVLRVPAKGKQCTKKRETALRWNQAGIQGAPGTPGAAGAAGAAGQQGPAGTLTVAPDSLTGTDILESSLGTVPSAAKAPIEGYELVSQSDAVSSTDFRTQSASCPSGKKVIGGGAGALSLNGVNMEIRDSHPFSDGSGWTAFAYEEPTTANTWNWQVWAVCAKVAP